MFAAIAATAFLVVLMMALLVALSMREGFTQYLLKAELTRFDDLAEALAARDTRGWPDLANDPRLWNDMVRTNTGLRSPAFGPPSRRVPLSEAHPPPGPLPNQRPPPGGSAPELEERLVLLDVDGRRIAGAHIRAGLFERRPVCAQTGCSGAGLLGYIGLNAPTGAGNAGDAFFLRGQYVSLALSALLAIAISAGAAYLVAQRLLVPIRRLEAGAKTLAAGNYTARMKQDRSDELGQLIGHYNTLAATLEQTSKAEKEWISNTSHELQTPLAVLRAQIEALQDGIRQPDDKTLGEMHAALMRLSHLVQDLKTLSYARETELATNAAAHDLARIARQAGETARPQMAAKGITLTLDLPPHLFILCEGERIAQVVDNLLSNAARYTDAPGIVRLHVHEDGDFAMLMIEDTPPGVPDVEAHKLFDRFYRVEGSRSRAHGGSGLGLAICKAIVEAHGGTITAGPSEMGGLQICVRLPKGAV
ncbi:ATP-binding protein [Rhodobacteraceae bacterium KMM 6894]|nr:ATP-binding protein [Rhodobacteraceae bacterium KMM 6894]